MNTTPYQYLRYMETTLLETLPSVKTRESRNTHSQRTWEKVWEDNQSYIQLFCVFFVVTKVAVVAFNRVLNLSMEIQDFIEGILCL